MTVIADYIGKSATDNVRLALDAAKNAEQYHAL